MARAFVLRALVGGLALALGAGAILPGAAPAQVYHASEAENEAWAKRLAEAQRELEAARKRAEQAEAAYVKAVRDDYPTGDALVELREEAEQAKAELREAEARLPALVEEARRSGVLPEVLRPYR